jgi:hypothetical protein
MAGNLIIPRVEVYWGKVNLTSYDGNGNYPTGEPLVYKVECTLPREADNPSGSMLWAPTAGAYKVYEELLKNNADDQIVTTFGYPGKKKISMVWIWGGNQYTYGNSMALRVTLLSELSGLINATTRSVANNADESMAMQSAIKKTEKSFAVEKFKLIRYTADAQKDLESNKILNQYTRDTTFVSAINNIVKENGNYVFSTNIVSDKVTSDSSPITGRTETASKLVVFTPFQYDGKADVVLDGQSVGYNQFFDPAKRYGYLIGPSIINTMERTFRWSPPQQMQAPTPKKTANPSKTGKKRGKKAPVETQVSRSEGTGAVRNTALAASNPGISVARDSVGPDKQIFQQEEAAAQLSFNTFLVPALVGIKPYDIVYIPSLNPQGVGDIEDWIVNTVDYNQTDGGVDISVTASRTYGIPATLMSQASGQKFLEKAKTLSTLEKWEEYAWIIASREPTVSADTLSNGEVNPTLAENYRRSGDSFD